MIQLVAIVLLLLFSSVAEAAGWPVRTPRWEMSAAGIAVFQMDTLIDNCNDIDDTTLIQNAINATSDDDTVTIVDTCRVTSRITVGTQTPLASKRIHIRGLGVGVINVATSDQCLFTIYYQGARITELSGLRINQTTATKQSTNCGIVTARGTGWGMNVHDNLFVDVKQHLLEPRNTVFGVWHHNTWLLPDQGRDPGFEGGQSEYPVGGLLNPGAASTGGRGSLATALFLGNSAPTSGTPNDATYGDAIYVEFERWLNCAVILVDGIYECDPNAATRSISNATDGEGGTRAVFRYNEFHQLNLVTHGTEGGVNVGWTKCEWYGNVLHFYGSHNARGMHQRSCNGVAFDNQFIHHGTGRTHLNHAFTLYRGDQGLTVPPQANANWGKYGGTGTFDVNGAILYTGTHDGGDGESVLLEDDPTFPTTMDSLIPSTTRYGIQNTTVTSPWYGYTGNIYANRDAGGGSWKVYTRGDHTINSLRPSDGTACSGSVDCQPDKCNLIALQFNPSYIGQNDSQVCFNTGDTYAIRELINPVHGVGWHGGSLISSVNQVLIKPQGWVQDLIPYYVWNNTIDNTLVGGGVTVTPFLSDPNEPDKTSGSPAAVIGIAIPNRDFYNHVDDTGVTNPDCPVANFDGTCGMGVGTLAQRPATCTAGVGYWANDQGGNWNKLNADANDGGLYKCTATDTWSLYYTPLDVPHPIYADAEEEDPPPTLSSITPNSGLRGSTYVDVAFTGTSFDIGGAAINESCMGVTISNLSVDSATLITADVALAVDATLGECEMTVSTTAGTSGILTFNVEAATAPTLTSISPTAAYQGTTFILNLTGTAFDGGNGFAYPFGGTNGLTISGCVVNSAVSMTCKATVAINASPLNQRPIRVVTDAGESSGQLLRLLPSGSNNSQRMRILR